MSVVIETTLGDITVDLFLPQRPRACLNFLKLCKMKYYNFNLFHTISRGFIAQTGDPTGSRSGGESIFGLLEGPSKRFFEGENEPRIKHTRKGLISFVGNEERMIGSQFFITLGEDLTYLDEKHCVFGEVVEGHDILEEINEAICDTDDRPYQDIRITHTVILDDPYADPKMLRAPSRSPSPSAERLQGGRIAPDENVDETEGKTFHEIAELQAEREAKARATILEMVGDLPAAEMAPPENVLFVCKLNPVTTDDDLEIIFNRFGKIKSCEIIRDRKTNDSLQYAFIEFEDEKSCEDAYFKMDNVLIDDRRIHVDFSQSVSKLKWHGKGQGVSYYDHKGKKTNDYDNEIGKGNYKISSNRKNDSSKYNSRSSDDPKKDSERYKREKSHSKSPSRARDTPERSKRQPALKRSRRDNNSRMDHSQPRSVKRVSRSHSRSPRRQPSGSNDRRGSPRRREEHRSSTFGRDPAKHIRNEVHSRNRDRSRSPAYVRKSSHDNRSRSDKVTSRSSHNEAYSKSDRNTRNETNQSRKDKSPNSEKRSTEESRKRSHRKIKKDIDKSENKSRTDKTIQSKSETGNVKKNKYSKSSEKENGKNNKEQKRRKNSDKDRNKRRQKKSKESSDSSTSSSSSDSSSHSSSSDSSDSSSESDSSDSEIEKKKRRKTKKRTASTSSDSDTDRSRSKSRKKKKKIVHRNDSSSSSEDSKRQTKKTKRKR